MKDLTHDVVIVGGGLAGASLACSLSGHGLRIASIEAAPFKRRAASSYDDRSLSLAYGSRRIFETLGLWSAVDGAATPIHSIEISQRGHFGRTRLDRRDQRVPALGYVIEARVLGQAILERLEGLDDVDVYCPASMKALQVDTGHVEVHVDKDQEEDRRLRSRVVVGADGARSRVREMLGIDARTVDYGQSAVIANVTPGRPHENRAFERFCDSGPMALLPLPGGRCGVVWSAWTGDAEAVMALPEERFVEKLQARLGRPLGRFTRVGRRSCFPLQLTVADDDVRPRAAIIGNAAHALHPVAGQGFNVGLRDVATLAEVIVDAHRQQRDIGSLAVLEEYGRWRRRDQRGTTLLTDGLVRLFSNDLRPLAALRALGLIGLDLVPPARRALTRRTMGLAGRVPRLARGMAL